MEEAAHIASEYIYTLDNLPTEIKFVMEEIRLKDVATQELQNAVNRRITRANPRLHQMSQKDANLMERIQPDCDKIEILAKEKVMLAQKLCDLMEKHCARLEHDLNRVRVASGEVPVVPETPMFTPYGNRGVEKVVENPRVAIAPLDVAPSPPPSAGLPALKRRRVGSNIGIVNNGPVLLSSVVPPRSRLSGNMARPSPPARRATIIDIQPSEDSHGEDAEDAAEDATDSDEVYCTCRQHSFGEMVGCDGPGCAFGGWFHMSCVGLKPPLPEVWYCDDCRLKNNFSVETTTMRGNERGGRKRGRK